MPKKDSDAQGAHGHRPMGDGPVIEEGRTRTLRTLKKRRMTRRTKTIIGAILTAILVLSMAWMIAGTSEREVTIVAILPLSGASSYLVELEEALTMTVEKMNQWGGINGIRIRLVVMDCESSPEVAVEKLRDADERYDPLVVLTATRGAATPMSTYAEENEILLISIGATAETLTEGKEWIFRYYVTPSGEAENALWFLGEIDADTVGILHLDDAYGIPLMEQVSDGFESMGGTVETCAFPTNATEFSEQVACVVDNDAVFVVALRHQYPYIFDMLNASGYSGHVLAAVESSIPEMWVLPEADGVMLSAPMMYSPTAAIDTEFVQEFEERYEVPLTHQGAIGSDVMKLIWGLLSDSDVSKENLRQQLTSGFIFSGILGVTTVEQGAHNVDVSVYPAVIEGGELRYLI